MPHNHTWAATGTLLPISPHQQCADVEQQDLLGGASVISLTAILPCMQQCAAKAVHMPGNVYNGQ